MTLRSNGSYIGPRPAGPSLSVASGIWDLRTAERQQRAAAWPIQVVTDPDFASVSLLLHMDGSGNTFTDSSASPKTLTAAGDVTQSTAQSKWGGKSALFDGNGDYISVANTSGLDFGTGDFAAEFWIYFTNSVSTSQQILYSETTGGFFIGLFNSGEIGIGRSGVAWDHYASHSMTTNTWNHIAIARSGTSLRIFVNGSQVGTTYTNSQSYTLAGGSLRIGGTGVLPGGDQYNVTGYIDDVRITKGTARGYTGATITVPTAAFPDAVPGTDPLFSLVSLLLHMDGSGSTFTDSSGTPKTITASGNATQSADQSKFGGKSGYFDGTGDYLTVSDEGQFDFSGDFTIECWAYSSRTSGNQGGLFSKRDYSTFGGVLLNHYGDGRLQMLATADNSSWSVNAQTATGTFPVSAWAHIAVVRSGSTMTLYVDGVSRATGTINGAIANNSEPFVIAGGGSNGADAFTGYIDEFRVTNSARYLSGFTPPTAAFPDA